MASGIEVEDECIKGFEDLKLKKTFKFVLFKISKDLKTIKVHHKEDEDLKKEDKNNMPDEQARSRFEDFKKKVTELEGATYCIVDVNFWLDEPNGSKRPTSKIALLNWCPDTLTIKQKMLFASSKDALKKKFGEGFKEVNCNGLDEFDYDEVVSKLKV